MKQLEKVWMLSNLLEYILKTMKYQHQAKRMVNDSQLVILLKQIHCQYYPLTSDQMLWLQLYQQWCHFGVSWNNLPQVVPDVPEIHLINNPMTNLWTHIFYKDRQGIDHLVQYHYLLQLISEFHDLSEIHNLPLITYLSQRIYLYYSLNLSIDSS